MRTGEDSRDISVAVHLLGSKGKGTELFWFFITRGVRLGREDLDGFSPWGAEGPPLALGGVPWRGSWLFVVCPKDWNITCGSRIIPIC